MFEMQDEQAKHRQAKLLEDPEQGKLVPRELAEADTAQYCGSKGNTLDTIWDRLKITKKETTTYSARHLRPQG